MNRAGYGAMQLAGPKVWGPPDDPESARRVLRLAVELGVTFFDTANAYGPRTVNQLIGEALRPFPEGVIVGNKVGAGRGPDRSWIITGHPDTVRRQVHEALADLGTQASELTYLRLAGDTPGAQSSVPLEDSLGVLTELRDQGLIRRIGLSGASPEMLARSWCSISRRAATSRRTACQWRPAAAGGRDPGPRGARPCALAGQAAGITAQYWLERLPCAL